MSFSKQKLASQIKSLRKASDFTQQDLAAEADISASTVAKLEQAKVASPTVEVLMKVAQAFQVSLEELVTGEVPQKQLANSSQPESRGESSLNNIQFIYFDVGGVLLHWRPALMAFSHRIARPFEEVLKLYETYVPLAYQGHMSMYDLQLLFLLRLQVPVQPQRQSELFRNWTEDMTPVAPTHRLLPQLGSRYGLGLLTNTMMGLLEDAFQQGLVPEVAYDKVIQSNEEGFYKPQPALFEIATERAGVPASQILLVDDTPENVSSAKNFGWHSVYFDESTPMDSARHLQSMLGV